MGFVAFSMMVIAVVLCAWGLAECYRVWSTEQKGPAGMEAERVAVRRAVLARYEKKRQQLKRIVDDTLEKLEATLSAEICFPHVSDEVRAGFDSYTERDVFDFEHYDHRVALEALFYDGISDYRKCQEFENAGAASYRTRASRLTSLSVDELFGEILNSAAVYRAVSKHNDEMVAQHKAVGQR